MSKRAHPCSSAPSLLLPCVYSVNTLLCVRLLRNCLAIRAGIGACKVNVSLAVSYYCFPLPDAERKWLKQLDLMSSLRQFRSHCLRNCLLHLHIAAVKGSLGEARLFHRSLYIHAIVHHIRYKLRMRLRLVPAAHNAKPDMDIPFFHERRDDGVER